MFCDELELKIVAGAGGDGCVSFRREKFVPRGGPNGGDGGNGGNVVFKVNTHLNTLGHLANKKIYKADRGVHGMGKNMHGANAEDLVLEVPKGTIIYNHDKSEIIADLTKTEQEVTIARGGKGGLGNARFVSSTHQAPRFAENGEPGETKEITLELKLVAELGFIGLPSAGKSTLISVVSNAKPKIAAYHFTTLVPNLGVVKMSKFGGSSESSFVVADIPGLIEGASQGKGLGHQFLKHITRTKLLVHVIDGSLPATEENYKTIINELKEFDKKLPTKEKIVVINKIDLLSDEEISEKIKQVKKIAKGKKIIPISAASNQGIKELMFEAEKQLETLRKEQEEAVEPEVVEVPILRPQEDLVKFEVEKIIKKENYTIYRISGARIEQLFIMTNTNNVEGVERLYHYIDRLGIKDAIEKKGAKIGDKIKVGEKSIPYRK